LSCGLVVLLIRFRICCIASHLWITTVSWRQHLLRTYWTYHLHISWTLNLTKNLCLWTISRFHWTL